MPATVIAPILHDALDRAERATRAALARLAYTQRQSIARGAIGRGDGVTPVLVVGERYVFWPMPPIAARFAAPRALREADLRWTLAIRRDDDASAGAPREHAIVGEFDDLVGVLTALVRELLADRFLPMRHRRAQGAAAIARDELAQPSRSMWWFWR